MIGKFYLVIVLLSSSGVNQHTPNPLPYNWEACQKAGRMAMRQNEKFRNVSTSFNCIPSPDTAATMEESK